MKRLIPVLLITLISCKENLPSGILKSDKMQHVLFDVMQADEVVSMRFSRDSSYDRLSKSVELYQNVFNIHNISSQKFKTSFLFYQNHPELLKPILDSLQKTTQRKIDLPIKAWQAK